MVESFNVDKNFWEEYPDVKIIEPFKSLYSNDKSKDKKVSSMMMWFIALCYSPASKFYKQPIEEKHPTIGEDFCGDSLYYEQNQVQLDNLIPAWIKWSMSELAQHVHELKELLHNRSAFIRSQRYDLENYEKLDKMVANTKTVFDNLKKAEEELLKEDGLGTGKGGAVASLND